MLSYSSTLIPILCTHSKKCESCVCWQELLRLSNVAAARVSDLHPQTQSEQAILTGLIQELRAILDTQPANLTPHANGAPGMSVVQPQRMRDSLFVSVHVG